MKWTTTIRGLEKEIAEAKYADPAYEPGRSTSSVKTITLDVPEGQTGSMRQLVMQEIADYDQGARRMNGTSIPPDAQPGHFYGFSGFGWRGFTIKVNGEDIRPASVNFNDLSNQELLKALRRIIVNGSAAMA